MKTASTINKKTSTLKYENEDENFWKNHTISFSNSGLSKIIYCRQSGINYPRFLYWQKKISSSQEIYSENILSNDNKNYISVIPPLLPVQLKQEPDSIKHSIHCSLSLKNGSTLHIHDQKSLLIILEKWS